MTTTAHPETTIEAPAGLPTRLTIVSVVDTVATRDVILASGMDSGVREGYVKLDALLLG